MQRRLSVPEKPAFDIVFNRGREDEFSISIRQSDLEEMFERHIKRSKSTLFNRIYDTSDGESVAAAKVHYAKVALAAVVAWGAAMSETDGERTD